MNHIDKFINDGHFEMISFENEQEKAMRDLTKQEIDNAPEWAVEYYFDGKDLWYVNKKWGMGKMLGRVRNLKMNSSVLIEAKPIATFKHPTDNKE